MGESLNRHLNMRKTNKIRLVKYIVIDGHLRNTTTYSAYSIDQNAYRRSCLGGHKTTILNPVCRLGALFALGIRKQEGGSFGNISELHYTLTSPFDRYIGSHRNEAMVNGRKVKRACNVPPMWTCSVHLPPTLALCFVMFCDVYHSKRLFPSICSNETLFNSLV